MVKNILVTGGAGFIGSHVVVELLARGFNVVVCDNFCNSKRSVLERIKQISNREFSFYEVDLRDYARVRGIFEKEKIDCVMHFAALKSGADSIKNPGLYYSNNIESTRNLVNAMNEFNVHFLIFSSSATVYGNSKEVPIIESSPVGDVISPYGMTKYLNELYLSNIANSFKAFKVIMFRYFNPIGAHSSGLIGEDSPDDIPNNLMLYLLKVANKELPFLNIFGNDYNTPDGTGIRDYIHVVDLALGHISALNYFDKMNNYSEVFNLGTGDGYSVLELVQRFEIVNKVKIPIKMIGRRPGDVEKSFASVEKAKKLLNWSANMTLDDCVRDAWNFKRNKINSKRDIDE